MANNVKKGNAFTENPIVRAIGTVAINGGSSRIATSAPFNVPITSAARSVAKSPTLYYRDRFQ